MSRIASIPPFLALVLVVGGFYLSDFAGFVLSQYFRPDVFPPDTRMFTAAKMSIGLPILLGYPLIITSELYKTFGKITAFNRKFLLATLVCVTVGYPILFFTENSISPQNPGIELVVSPLILLTLVSALYIFWVAARALVFSEAGHRVSFNRVIGTFLMFFALPLGVFFLQHRLRRLMFREHQSRPEQLPQGRME